jgi:hypothetical protein
MSPSPITLWPLGAYLSASPLAASVLSPLRASLCRRRPCYENKNN